MDSRFLYRGVSRNQYNRDGGLRPKSVGSFSYVFRADGSIRAGEGAVAGKTESNAVLRHQLRQEGFPTAGISTTPLVERAAYYATKGHSGQVGRVVKIDRTLLPTLGIREYIVREWVENPAIPLDDEVILVVPDGGALPPEVVIEIVDV